MKSLHVYLTITLKVNKPQQNTSRSKTVWHQMVLVNTVNNIMLMSYQFKKQGHTINVNKFGVLTLMRNLN